MTTTYIWAWKDYEANHIQTAESLGEIISVVLTDCICDDEIANRFLEIHELTTQEKIVIYVPTFMINEDSIDFAYDFYVNKDCIQFGIDNTVEQTTKFLNHMCELFDHGDEITIYENK